jgi:hypothetical protein
MSSGDFILREGGLGVCQPGTALAACRSACETRWAPGRCGRSSVQGAPPQGPSVQMGVHHRAKRGVTEKIKRSLKRKAVVEPNIGPAKNDGLLRRNWLKGRNADRSNTVLVAVGFNFRQLLRFLRAKLLLRTFFTRPRLPYATSRLASLSGNSITTSRRQIFYLT